MVQLIFVVEEFPARLAMIINRRIAQESNVAARAKAAPLCMINHDAFHRIIVAPRQQRLRHCMHHKQRQRIQRRWPVQAYDARMAFDADISSELIINYLILRSHPACASLKCVV
jgi:hypothetical protein